MTIVEALLSVVVVSLVGGAALAMLFATARATEASADSRKAAVRAMTVGERLHHDIIASRAVLYSAADTLVLWAHDDNESQTVNLDELLLIERTSGDTTIRRWAIEWPDGLSQAAIDAANTQYAASANFATTAAAMKSHAYAVAEQLSSKAQSLTITLKGGAAQSAKLVTVGLALSVEGTVQESIVVAALRSHAAPQ